MARLVAGHAAFERLLKALGIGGPVKRVVIDAACDDAVVVYVQAYAEKGPLDAAEDVLAEAADECRVVRANGISVDEKGNVRIEG